MALGSTQPLTEMSTRSISWGKRRPVRKADNLPPSCAIVTKSGNLNSLTDNTAAATATITIRLLLLNLLTPNVKYSGRTAPLTSKVSFYIFIQQIQVLNILNMVYTLCFFFFKMQFVS